MEDGKSGARETRSLIFLVKNSMTNNAAVVEIKRPQTEVISNQKVNSDVYTPSTQLVKAISQTLDQKNRFEQEITQIKIKNRLYDLESYAVQCCLIIGRLPGDDDRLRSFEMFRGNSKDVKITTFDELLEQLRHLSEFLKPPEPGFGNNVGALGLPF